MPSWVAMAAAALSSIITSVFGFPLLWLQGFAATAGGGVLLAVVQVLRAPFARVASLVLFLGIAVQTGVLLEEYGVDRVGEWLNSATSSTPANGVRSVPAHAERLEHLATVSYPSTLALVLDSALELPTPQPGDTFTAEDIAEWEQGSAAFRKEYERLAAEVAGSWLDMLDWADAPPTTTSNSTDPHPRPEDRLLLLTLAASELAAVQAGSPTRAIYATEPYTHAELAAADARRAAREAEAARAREQEFEQWVEGIISRAEADAGAGPNEGEGESPGGSTREMLDLPVGAGDGAGTWRDALRSGWEAMYVPEKGGIMGDVAQSLRLLAGDDKEDDNDEEDDSRAGDWTPDPLPLMANHFARAQLTASIAVARRLAGVERFPPADPADDALLPRFLESLPVEQLSVVQRTLLIDRRARTYAAAFLALVHPPAGQLHDSAALSTPDRVALLRRSPLPRFLRATTALFHLPQTHLRMGVSTHLVSQAVFSLQTPAVELPAWQRAEGAPQRAGGCSAVVLEMEKRRSPEAWELAHKRIAVKAAGGALDGEARDGGAHQAREEL